MFHNTKAFSGFAVSDLTEARKFYEGALGIGWFTDPSGNILSVLQER